MSANVSADRGAVAAGRNVVADLIVTGDRNTFFIGGYQRLSEVYIDPGEVIERVAVTSFVGREGLIAGLDDFLAAKACGYFVVEAAAGLGKTALLAHLVVTRGWVHHFCELAPGESGIAPARMSLAAQLIRAFDLRDTGAGAEPVLSEAAASRPDFLRGLLSDASAGLRPGEKLVFVVDALDEAGARPGENVLGLPQVLPAGVFAVVSKRNVRVALYTESPRRVVQIEPDSEGNRHDVRAYLNAAAPAGLVEPLLAKSHGVWIYVRYALLQSEVDPDALPEGLWAWYHRFWSAWAGTHAAEWHREHLPLLATLAAAREDLTLPELCRFAEVAPAPAELPSAWRPYLTTRRERPRRYRLYHASLGDYLHGLTATEDTAEQDFADALGEATRAAHDRIAERYLTAWGNLEDGLPGLAGAERYGLAHVPAHLRRAERHDELFALVDEGAWRTAHLLRDPSAGGFLGSVTEAWDCAVEVDRQAIEAGRPAPYLRREIACALSAEDVRSFAAYLPPSLLARLVAAGIWSPDEALASVGLSPYPYGRALSLAAVFPYLAEQQRVVELRAFFAWADGDRERSLGALAPHVPDALLADALRFASEIDEAGDRSEGLAALAPQLPAPLLADAVAVALAIDEPIYRVEALTALVPHCELDLRERALGAALIALDAAAEEAAASYFGRLVGGLAPEAPEPLLALAATVEEPEARAEAVAALAPHLDSDQLAGAFAGALAPDRDVLRVLAPHLPAELVHAAVSAAGAIEDPDERALALVELAPRLPVERRGEALATARDPHALAETIVGLAPELGDAQLAEALRAATALEDPTHRAWALGVLTPHLPVEMRAEALAAVHAIPTQWDRDRALGWIENALATPWEGPPADEMSPEESAAELPEELAEAAEIDEAYDRQEALEELVPLLPDAMLPDAVRAALAPVDTSERAELWTMLAERRPACEPAPTPVAAPLPPDERAAALAAATALEDAGDRLRALAELCERIPAGDRSGELTATLVSALDDAASTLGSRRLSRALRAVSPQLPEALLPRAFAIASRIPRSRMRRHALEDMAVSSQTASPLVQHTCLDIALRASVEVLDVPRFVRSLLPMVDRLVDGGGVPWKQS